MNGKRAQRGAKARARGHAAESLAALWLRLKGYRILARNWRSPAGEIDIIARKGKALALVEVKARGDLATAATALQGAQQRRLLRGLDHYLKLRPDLAGLSIRCDCILIGSRILPRHVKDAWR